MARSHTQYVSFLVMIVACLLGFAGPVAAKDVTVKIDNFTFSPEVLTIERGTRVIFENHDDIPHSVVGVGGKFKSPPLDTDENFSVTFAEPGEIAYFCGLHPHMTGKIVVNP